MTLRSRFYPALVILLTACVSSRTSDLTGTTWESSEPRRYLHFTRDTIVTGEPGRVGVARVLKRGEGTVIVMHNGYVRDWQVTQTGDELVIRNGAETSSYTRHSAAPDELSLKPFYIPAPINGVSLERIEEIKLELSALSAREQVLLKNPKRDPAVLAALRVEMVDYLRKLFTEAGWIDVQRFGTKPSMTAVILVKHTARLSLLLGALPHIEADFKNAGPRAQAFAIAHDETMLLLGGRQRYGSQVCDIGNEPFVCPLEDPVRVDEMRREIGLEPLADYLGEVSRLLYDGKPVRMPTAREQGQV